MSRPILSSSSISGRNNSHRRIGNGPQKTTVTRNPLLPPGGKARQGRAVRLGHWEKTGTTWQTHPLPQLPLKMKRDGGKAWILLVFHRLVFCQSLWLASELAGLS